MIFSTIKLQWKRFPLFVADISCLNKSILMNIYKKRADLLMLRWRLQRFLRFANISLQLFSIWPDLLYNWTTIFNSFWSSSAACIFLLIYKIKDKKELLGQIKRYYLWSEWVAGPHRKEHIADCWIISALWKPDRSQNPSEQYTIG